MIVADLKRVHAAASAVRSEVIAQGLCAVQPQSAWEDMYDTFVTDKKLRTATRRLYFDKHYAQAVEEAYKYLNNRVKERSGMSADGASLMRSALSPNNPKLRLNRLQTESQKNQQQGYMDILAGCMTGIRNPRAHTHRHEDDARTALEMLAWANHLLRMVDAATRTRRQKKAKTK